MQDSCPHAFPLLYSYVDIKETNVENPGIPERVSITKQLTFVWCYFVSRYHLCETAPLSWVML